LGDGCAVVLAPDNPDVIFCAGYVYAGSSYRVQTALSTDGGTTWAHETLPDLAVRANTALFDPANPSRILMGGDLSYSASFLRISTDLGATWSAGEDGLSGAVNTIVAVPSQPGTFYCGTTQGCFQSTDGGLTWNQKGDVSAVQAITVDTIDPDIIYAGTQSGVHYSTDGGDNWSQYGTALPVSNVLSLTLVSGSSGALLAGTNGASAFSIAPVAGIGEQPDGKHDARPAQLGIAPNPFRTRTAISLQLTAHSPAQVSVYDESGRVVRSIPVPQSTIGNRQSEISVTWDGRDQAGRPVQAGAYFVRTDSGSSRLVLVR